jgi:hypothetical protein
MIGTLSHNSLDQQLHLLMLTQLHHEVILEFATIYLHREQHFVISPCVDVSLARDHCDTGAHLEVLLLFPYYLLCLYLCFILFFISESQIALIVYEVSFPRRFILLANQYGRVCPPLFPLKL